MVEAAGINAPVEYYSTGAFIPAASKFKSIRGASRIWRWGAEGLVGGTGGPPAGSRGRAPGGWFVGS